MKNNSISTYSTVAIIVSSTLSFPLKQEKKINLYSTNKICSYLHEFQFNKSACLVAYDFGNYFVIQHLMEVLEFLQIHVH